MKLGFVSSILDGWTYEEMMDVAADCFAIFAITRSLPDTKAVAKAASEGGRSCGSNRGFMGKYPSFVLTLVGLVLLLSFHNGINTYMLQLMENVGGNSAARLSSPWPTHVGTMQHSIGG